MSRIYPRIFVLVSGSQNPCSVSPMHEIYLLTKRLVIKSFSGTSTVEPKIDEIRSQVDNDLGVLS